MVSVRPSPKSCHIELCANIAHRQTDIQWLHEGAMRVVFLSYPSLLTQGIILQEQSLYYCKKIALANSHLNHM